MSIERYVLTGGLRSGKSTLIDYLAREGFNIFPEAIIEARDELYKGKISDVHKERDKWVKLIIQKGIEHFENAIDGINFYDRAMPCYAILSETFAPQLYKKALNLAHSMRYSSPVFFFESIKPFVQRRRYVSKEVNEMVEEKTKELYAQLGYEIIEIPFFTTDENENNLHRKETILKYVKIN